jgi:hypothetical protein
MWNRIIGLCSYEVNNQDALFFWAFANLAGALMTKKKFFIITPGLVGDVPALGGLLWVDHPNAGNNDELIV